jgi:hypothetical protein
MLTPREEINNETNPLWSIEIKRQNIYVYKGYDEEVILEANLSIFVKPQQYAQIFVCSTIGIYTMEKVFPFLFGETRGRRVQHTTKKQLVLHIGTLDTKKHRAKGASATHDREKRHIVCLEVWTQKT